MDSLTLPAWPGLVRLATVVGCEGRRGVVTHIDEEIMVTWGEPSHSNLRFNAVTVVALGLTVDLTDETSRCHVAWWCIRQQGEWSRLEEGALDNAVSGSAMTDEQIATLRDLALRLHADLPEQQEARTQRMLADWPETFARLAEGPGSEGGDDV